MADERNQDQNTEQDKGKAMGAGASVGSQGQRLENNPPNETAGQGGGIQGTGQRQSNPGGYTQEPEQRDDRRGNENRDKGSNDN